MRNSYTKLPGYDVELADIGEGAAYRIYIFRHTGLSRDEERIIEQVPGSRTLIIGGRRTKHELRLALQDIGRPQLGQLIGSTVSGKAHTALRAYLNLS